MSLGAPIRGLLVEQRGPGGRVRRGKDGGNGALNDAHLSQLVEEEPEKGKQRGHRLEKAGERGH